MTIRLMVVDDHELIRAGLTQYFEMQQGVEVVAEAANGSELLERLKTTPVDILLLDMTMPGISGVERIKVIKTLYPALRILILSAYYDVPTVLSAMRAGASGYISKNSAPQTLLEAVKEVMMNGKYLARDMAEKLLYASVSAQPYSDEIKDHSGVARLDGKTIREWKEDCVTFYQEKETQKEINAALDRKNIEVENENYALSEKVRHFEKRNPGNEFD